MKITTSKYLSKYFLDVNFINTVYLYNTLNHYHIHNTLYYNI